MTGTVIPYKLNIPTTRSRLSQRSPKCPTTTLARNQCTNVNTWPRGDRGQSIGPIQRRLWILPAALNAIQALICQATSTTAPHPLSISSTILHHFKWAEMSQGIADLRTEKATCFYQKYGKNDMAYEVAETAMVESISFQALLHEHSTTSQTWIIYNHADRRPLADQEKPCS